MKSLKKNPKIHTLLTLCTAAVLAGAMSCELVRPAAATPEYLLPTLFDVVDVTPGDSLNIRAAPDARSEILGQIAPDAAGVEVVGLDPSGRWGQVNADEIGGWVAMRHLAYRSDVWEAGRTPPGLGCRGTEPFWSLRPEAGRLVFATPGAERILEAEVLDTGVFRDPRRMLIGRDDAERVTAAITPEQCSDGMSDRIYGLKAMLAVEETAGTRLLIGCCSIGD